jgi:DNA-binding transcriptional ArsR family regulator
MWTQPDPLPVPGAARLFRLLSDPTRLRLLLRLAEGGELSVVQLAEAVGGTRASVTNHLHLLHQAGIVASRRAGRCLLHRLSSDRVRDLLGLVR